MCQKKGMSDLQTRGSEQNILYTSKMHLLRAAQLRIITKAICAAIVEADEFAFIFALNIPESNGVIELCILLLRNSDTLAPISPLAQMHRVRRELLCARALPFGAPETSSLELFLPSVHAPFLAFLGQNESVVVSRFSLASFVAFVVVANALFGKTLLSLCRPNSLRAASFPPSRAANETGRRAGSQSWRARARPSSKAAASAERASAEREGA